MREKILKALDSAFDEQIQNLFRVYVNEEVIGSTTNTARLQTGLKFITRSYQEVGDIVRAAYPENP